MKKYALLFGGLAMLGVFSFAAVAYGNYGKYIKFADSPNIYKLVPSWQEFIGGGGTMGQVQTVGEPQFGGVNIGNEYHSSTFNYASSNTQQIKTTAGTLGTVINYAATSGGIVIYNATTSDVTKRALATTSLTKLADFPASTAAGSYIFDTWFTQGLLVVFTVPIASSTLTYR